MDIEVIRPPADLEFVSFCIETYARKNRISGADTAERFQNTGVLDYLFANYEMLHTQGAGYILSLIDEFLEKAA
jgi:hypothetical protein